MLNFFKRPNKAPVRLGRYMFDDTIKKLMQTLMPQKESFTLATIHARICTEIKIEHMFFYSRINRINSREYLKKQKEQNTTFVRTAMSSPPCTNCIY